MEQHLFNYKARVVEIYDGDTCTIDIDLGFSTWLKGEKIRLLRINAPEVKGSSRIKGIKSRDALKKMILGKDIFLQTIKDRKEKYGRYLGEVWVKQTKDTASSRSQEGYININDWMVSQGFAVYKQY
ncbi:MAG: thermonuclease family protein [Bacteroidota bacterium]|nr:thermonuclease family protein [Bacteroidota bacterium]